LIDRLVEAEKTTGPNAPVFTGGVQSGDRVSVMSVEILNSVETQHRSYERALRAEAAYGDAPAYSLSYGIEIS
jgi:hypothetical protein